MNWREFHDFTKHTPVRYGGHTDDPDRPEPLDPSRRPHPFKEYADSPEAIPLIDNRREWLSGRHPVDEFEELSRTLLIGAGAKRFKSGPMTGRYFRTYASAGALHPNEIYVATRDLPGLTEGLYHFNPRDKVLIRLGTGDPRAEVSAASGVPLGSSALIVTGIPWRTAWKYGPRGYRHLWWDAGMIVANFLALAESRSQSARVMVDFDDRQMNRLIGVDGRTEMTLAVISLEDDEESSTTSSYRSYDLEPLPVGPMPYEFSEITAVHRATSVRLECSGASGGGEHAVLTSDKPVDRVIWRRGSTRRFDRSYAMEADALESLLRYASSSFCKDWTLPAPELCVVAHAVSGIEAGVYRWDGATLRTIRTDDRTREAGYFLSLQQALGHDASALIFPMADLDLSVSVCGPRGYRGAQLDGAVQAGRLYLAAYATGLGATGLTFFDDQVSKYFQTNREPMLEVAVGAKASKQTLAIGE